MKDRLKEIAESPVATATVLSTIVPLLLTFEREVGGEERVMRANLLGIPIYDRKRGERRRARRAARAARRERDAR